MKGLEEVLTAEDYEPDLRRHYALMKYTIYNLQERIGVFTRGVQLLHSTGQRRKRYETVALD
jgi:hypothetical protein